MYNQSFFVHSRVYSDTFENKPYSMSMREDIEVTTPDLIDYSSDYYDEVEKLRQARIAKKRAEREATANEKK